MRTRALRDDSDTAIEASRLDWTAAQRAAAAYDAWFDRPWGRYAFAVESAAVRRALDVREGYRVLDAGCGTGRFSIAMAQDGASVVGLDRDAAALRIAMLRAGAVVAGDASRLPFADETFDSCIAVTLCEFVAQPEQVVKELARVTRPGGRVVIGSLNRRSPWGLAHRRHFREPVWRSAKFFDQRKLRRFASSLGHTKREGALYVPDTLPLVSVWGPVAERLGRLAPSLGAFQILIVDKAPARQAFRSASASTCHS